MKRVSAVRETGSDYSNDGVTLSDYVPQTFTSYHTTERETLHQTDPRESSQEYQVADENLETNVDKVILKYQINVNEEDTREDDTHVEEDDDLDEETKFKVDVEEKDT